MPSPSLDLVTVSLLSTQPGFMHFARLLDRKMSFVRGLVPLVFWGAGFGILMLLVP